MPARRWLLLLLAGAVLDAGDAPLATRPLALSGMALETVDHALIRLAQGDTSAVEALPIEAFLDPVARADTTVPGLARRWTGALPAALGRLGEGARTQALTRLDARYRTLAATRDPAERPRLASAFLPAPAAVTELTRALDRAFDLGRFGDYLGMAELLAPGSGTADPRRHEVAVRLSGLGPAVDASLRLPPPGSPLPSAGRPHVAVAHLALRWAVVPGWVLACDPFGQVVWQYRVDRLAQVTTGPGAVLVNDSSGLRALDEAGVVTPLRPLPSGAAVLAVAGGCAWFATGERAWRLELADGELHALALGAPPLGAPLVRGPQSLWLTARELLLFDEDRLVHRFQHRLPAASGWRLGADGERPLLLDGEERAWRLESFTDQLARLTGVERAELLIQAKRCAEALAVLGDPHDDRARRTALRAHLGLGPAHIAAVAPVVQALCRSPQDTALVRLAALAADAPPGHGPLRQVFARQGTTLAEAEALDRLCAATPGLLLTDDAQVLGDDPATWDHACSGAAWSAWRTTWAPIPLPRGDGALVRSEPVAAAAAGGTVRQADGSLLADGRRYRLERGLDVISVTCLEATGDLCWRQRWRPASFLSAPSQSIEIRGGVVMVLEGGMRLTAFDPLLGVRRGTFVVDDLGSGTAHLLDGGLAIIGPLGVDSMLTLSDERGTGSAITLPSPARWAVPLGGLLLVCGHDGQARLYPGGRVVGLPDALARTRNAPQATAAGLVLDGTLWPWAR